MQASNGGDLVSCDVVKGATSPEVLYPGVFSDVCFDGTFPPPPNCWSRNFITLPITHLSHVTHDLEAASIRERDRSSYCFIPNQKFGRYVKRDGTFIKMATFEKIRENLFKVISQHEPVFPGYISWWGINFQNCRQEFNADLSSIHQMRGNSSVYAADYLASPPCSRFGNKEFVFSVNDLMVSYKKSRNHSMPNSDVYLKNAGTLVYMYEVCYVVMVVMQEDLGDPAIQRMPSVYEDCSSGKLMEGNGGQLFFNVKRPFSWIKDQGGSVPWECLVFAFYFPNNGQLFWCPKQVGEKQVGEKQVGEVRNIVHDPYRCVSKRPCPILSQPH